MHSGSFCVRRDCNRDKSTAVLHETCGTAALFVAALAADGESIIRNTQYINRGYEKFVSNYRELGAEIIEI